MRLWQNREKLKSPQPLWYLTLALMPGTGTSEKGEYAQPLFEKKNY